MNLAVGAKNLAVGAKNLAPTIGIHLATNSSPQAMKPGVRMR